MIQCGLIADQQLTITQPLRQLALEMGGTAVVILPSPIRHAAVRLVEVLAAELLGVGDLPLRCGFVDLEAQARRGWQLDVAVHNLPILPQQPAAQALVDLFLDQEVGDDGIHVQRGGQRDRPDGAPPPGRPPFLRRHSAAAAASPRAWAMSLAR